MVELIFLNEILIHIYSETEVEFISLSMSKIFYITNSIGPFMSVVVLHSEVN